MNSSFFRRRSFRDDAATHLLFLALIFLITCLPASGAGIECHQVGRMGASGSPESVPYLLTGDTLVSEVCLADVHDGDWIRWELCSPGGATWNESHDLAAGQQRARMAFDLERLTLAEATGIWDLALFLDNKQVDQRGIEVRPPTGLSWWGPFAGTLVVLVVLAGIIVAVGIVVLAAGFIRQS